MKRTRRQIIDWEKIVGHHISDKGLVLRMQKKNLKSQQTKNTSSRKWAKKHEQIIQERIYTKSQ